MPPQPPSMVTLWHHEGKRKERRSRDPPVPSKTLLLMTGLPILPPLLSYNALKLLFDNDIHVYNELWSSQLLCSRASLPLLYLFNNPLSTISAACMCTGVGHPLEHASGTRGHTLEKMALPPPAAMSRFSWSLPPPTLECWLAWSSAGLGQAATVAVRSQVQQPCFVEKMLFHSSPSCTS